jgi:hypothetical protein
MKSTPHTRQKLRNRLLDACEKNPENRDLLEALDIVDDLIKYHSDMSNYSCVYLLQDLDTRTVHVYESSSMSRIDVIKANSRGVIDTHELASRVIGWLE